MPDPSPPPDSVTATAVIRSPEAIPAASACADRRRIHSENGAGRWLWTNIELALNPTLVRKNSRYDGNVPEVVRSGSAVHFRHGDAEEPGASSPHKHFAVNDVGLFPLLGLRHDRLLEEGAERLPKELMGIVAQATPHLVHVM
jgi:hypothetical protein